MAKKNEVSGDKDQPKVVKAPVVKKKFGSLKDYKIKNNIKDVDYKPQEWIDMSPAFKHVTKLPGIPMGHAVMNFGQSDVGKTTMAIEAGAHAQKQGILPVLVLTENKFSWERAAVMGLERDECIVFDGVRTLEEGVSRIKSVLLDQKKGELKYDLLFLWDSIGMTPTEAEWKVQEEDGGKTAMMVAAKVIRAQFLRDLVPKINETRRKEVPYTNTLLVVNHAYAAPPSPPATIGSLKPYGGDGLYLACTLVFRQGGIMSRSSKVKATKDGDKVAFAIKSALVVDKNHITNVAATGNILCTDHGFILDDKATIDAYKKEYKNDWDLEYDGYWNAVTSEK